MLHCYYGMDTEDLGLESHLALGDAILLAFYSDSHPSAFMLFKLQYVQFSNYGCLLSIYKQGYLLVSFSFYENKVNCVVIQDQATLDLPQTGSKIISCANCIICCAFNC